MAASPWTMWGVLGKPTGFYEELEWMIQGDNQGFVMNSVFYLLFYAAVYHLWGERNSRIFQAKKGDREMVLNCIRRDIRACLGSWKSASSCVLWWRIRVMLAISRKADTLWVHCIHTYMIKHRCRWYMPLPQDSSWTMRKIFKLPPLAQSVIKSVIGNGQSTFLWPDNWHPMGPSPPFGVW